MTPKLRSVFEIVKSQQKDINKINPSLEKLQRLSDTGLLNAYILLARNNAGIIKDYDIYREKTAIN